MAMPSLPPGHFDTEPLTSHPMVRRLRARRDATRRAELLGSLTPTARVVLAEADHLLEACRAWHRTAQGPLGVQPGEPSVLPGESARQPTGSRRPMWSSPG